MIRLRACPKCNGAMYFESKCVPIQFFDEWCCVQCGYRLTANFQVIRDVVPAWLLKGSTPKVVKKDFTEGY